ncbi:DUF438 domain-containing protein [Streptococcus caprae]|uniref:DUF438 domain-containing protein n=1 Tax=Streptococcus caprae TaxID=1640501 RepID=A0ABV8CY70_9STRE
MMTERIDMLKSILLRLHQGASPESVQEDFNTHFKGVSAIEIAMMEHELMSSDTGITFEDIMSLCNVHANLFKGVIEDVDVPDAEQEGHPVYVFKHENLALHSAILRIRRIIDNYSKPENAEFLPDMKKGLELQFSLLGQFDNHYTRKEKLFFPIMERYGHDAPPKVMWGVDDDIRGLFKVASKSLATLDQAGIAQLSQDFEAFAKEFEEMIFKEEAILLMILLESFTQDDWLAIAAESDAYGYAIIKPTQEWIPERKSFVTEEASEEPVTETVTLAGNQQVIETPEGQFTITFTPKEKSQPINRDTPQEMTHGYLSLNQANLILDHLPMEITFVNKDDIFQFYNNHSPAEEMIFKRTPSQVGRHVELCHPPKVLDKVKAIFELLRTGQRQEVTMWFKSPKFDNQFVHVTYKGVWDEAGEFQGVLEYVQNIQPYRDIDSDFNRDI